MSLNGEPTFSLDLKVQSIQTLTVVLNGEIRDRPGDRPQWIHHCSNIPIRCLEKHVEFLDGFKTCFVEGGINVLSLSRFRPLRNWPLQNISQGG